MNQQPSWHWPEGTTVHPDSGIGGQRQQPASSDTGEHSRADDAPNQPTYPPRTYPSRTCRICLETVHPTYHPPSESLPSFLRSGPRVTYESTDAELGRLLRPCKCKGSSRYVHEGCLKLWRNADPAFGKRNFWQCPTCNFQYRLERMRWGKWISSPVAQIMLTVSILFMAIFALGFIADPIINLYVDPFDTIAGQLWDDELRDVVRKDGPTTWSEHLFKGLASLGVLSFLKVLVALSPWQWWNLRNSGLMGGGSRRTVATGRDRAASISWIVLAIGVGTFLWVKLTYLSYNHLVFLSTNIL